MFWDGRATGWTLHDPLAEQAQGPFENPVEMGIDRNIVVERVAAASYASLFLQVYPDTDFEDVNGTYDNIARAIAAYERSSAVTKFNSRFDRFWKECQARKIDVSEIDTTTDLSKLPQGILTNRQLQGLALFNDADRGKCASCHSTVNFTDAEGNAVPPLFTDYTYANLGIPTNGRLYELAGGEPPDYGLGGFLESQKIDGYQAEYGKFKVPTLRNVTKSRPYGHNGYFTALEDVVHFLNTRNVAVIWPEPEYPATMSNELGDLQLTDVEEASIVAFMHSLTDDSQ